MSELPWRAPYQPAGSQDRNLLLGSSFETKDSVAVSLKAVSAWLITKTDKLEAPLYLAEDRRQALGHNPHSETFTAPRVILYCCA